MRPLYFLLKILLKLTLWIYYPRFKHINRPKKRFTRTIYMSNHAASFMDPLVIAGSQPPIVFFMTRSDVFKAWLKPILWAAHMLPIYRQHDGEDTHKKNAEVFQKCSTVLKYGRSLMIFAEGFTDGVFIRRLKPIKKGAVRIGFTALEEMNWKKEVYLQAIGVNYSNPNSLGSDCLISNGNPLCLNDYKAEYEKDPHKTIAELTRKMELDMRHQITDIRNEEMASFHENIMRITRKGMHVTDFNKQLLLEERWHYSQRLANWLNAQEINEKPELLQLKKKLEDYFKRLDHEGIKENALYKVTHGLRKPKTDVLYLTLLFPFFILGLIFSYLPYRFIKNFVEKSFKRSVFWGSVKMLVGTVAIGIYSLILLSLLSFFLPLSYGLILLLGIIFVPLLAVLAKEWHNTYQHQKAMNLVSKKDISALVAERREIEEEIYRLIPDA